MSMLANLNNSIVKQTTLQRLWDSISSIHFLSDLLANQASMATRQPIPIKQPNPINNVNSNEQSIPTMPSPPSQSIPQQNERLFTIEQLANYDGKDGKPAYVAVDGTVYDVTNNRAWAAATHFGLISGKNYTHEFATCHAGQQSILQTLPVVGRLA